MQLYVCKQIADSVIISNAIPATQQCHVSHLHNASVYCRSAQSPFPTGKLTTQESTMKFTTATSPTAGAPTRSSSSTARTPTQVRARRERRDDGRDRRGDRDERRGRGERQRPSPANTPGSQTADPPDMRDAHLPSLLSLPGNAQAVVQRMRELFGPMLPDDTIFEDATVADPALTGMAFTCNYDEGYCGHFTIPGGDGAAAKFGKVAEASELMPFVREHLETRPAGWQEGPAARETVMFAPGLNTLHKVKAGWEGEQTTPFRLEHYVRVRRPHPAPRLPRIMHASTVCAPPCRSRCTSLRRMVFWWREVVLTCWDGRRCCSDRWRSCTSAQTWTRAR